jgi:hypothetical protein
MPERAIMLSYSRMSVAIALLVSGEPAPGSRHHDGSG